MKVAFELDGITRSTERLLLTAALGAGQATIDTSYEIKKLNDLLDFANLMTYDVKKRIYIALMQFKSLILTSAARSMGNENRIS